MSGNMLRWLKRRYEAYGLLGDYFLAVKSTGWELVWADSVLAIAYCLWWFKGIPPWWVTMVFVISLIFVSGYHLWRVDHVRLEKKLEIAQVVPREWMDTSNSGGSGRPAKSYCIEVVNRSEAITVEDVTVQLNKMVPEVWNFLPIPLHLQHDNPTHPQDQQRSFNLNPNETKNIDLVSAFEGDNRFSVVHVVAGVNHQAFFDTSGNRLQVRITAKHAPSILAWFKVWRDDTGFIQCEIEQ